MGRPVHADGRQTRQAILDAALQLFAEKGYFGTSLRDIAAVVGVRESALYNYFKGKDALFVALLAAAQEQKAEHLSAVLEGPVDDVRAVLEKLTTLLLDSFTAPQQERLFRVLMSDGIRLAKEGRINFMDRMNRAEYVPGLMRRLVTAGRLRSTDPELLSMAFMGPLLLWRHCHAVLPDAGIVVNRAGFVREHVAQFLQGANTPPAVVTRRRPARAAVIKRPSARRRPGARVTS